jgi:hypothetical protein
MTTLVGGVILPEGVRGLLWYQKWLGIDNGFKDGKTDDFEIEWDVTKLAIA